MRRRLLFGKTSLLVRAIAFVMALAVGVTVAQWVTPVGASVASPFAPLPKRQVGLGVAERPDGVSAALAAKTQKRKIEITGERSERATTWANPDGTLTTTTSDEPVRVRQGTGWAPIDTTLVVDKTGVHPKAATGALVLSDGGDSKLVTSTVDGQSFGVDWPTALPKPTVAGSTATYAEVRPGVDLTVTANAAGYEYSLVVKKRPTRKVAAFDFPLRTPGLTVAGTAGGGLTFTGKDKQVVAHTLAPLAYGAAKDSAGQPSKLAKLPVTVKPGGTPALSLAPDDDFLADPTVTYPVTLDPTVVYGPGSDTYAQASNPGVNYNGSGFLVTGTSNGGGDKARSLITVTTPQLAGKHIISSTMSLDLFAGNACTTTSANPIYAQQVTTAWDPATVTWTSLPSYSASAAATSTISRQGTVGCPAQYVDFPITAVTQAWADGANNYGLILKAANESDNAGLRQFYSQDHAGGTPSFTVTYNSYPSTVGGRSMSPCSSQCGGSPATVITNTTTPTLRGAAADADGGTVRLDFEVWNAANTVRIANGSVPAAGANANVGWNVPSGLLTNGTTYQWKARAYDGTDYSKAWSTYIQFQVDTTAPAVPASVTSTAFPAGAWSTNTSGTFTWTSPGGDIAGFLYGMDQPSPSTATTGTTTPTLTPGDGLHKFYIRSKDKAGNLSPVVTYSFAVGNGALARPANQSLTARYVTIEPQAPPAQTTVRLQYRQGTDTALPWTAVPTADVVVAGTTTHPTWPTPRNGSSLFDTLTWDLAATVTAAGADGPVQLQACFRTSGGTETCITPKTILFSRHAFTATAGSAQVGPGSVALLTGDFSAAQTDVSMPTYSGTLTIGRTATTLAPPDGTAPATGVFGPGWSANLAGPDSGVADLSVADSATAGYATLSQGDGGQSVYSRTGAAGTYPSTYIGLADAATDGSKLVRDSATQFTHTDTDGTQTVFTSRTVGTATVWTAARVAEPGANATSTFTTDANGRITRILAPVPAGVSCTTLVAGCRALNLNYATATTATGSGSALSDYGDYTGRLATVTMSLNGGAPITVAKYQYDTTGRLRAEWDPRLDSSGSTVHVYSVYAYNGSNRLAWMGAPGEIAWGFTYDGTGRLATIIRTTPSSGTATRRVVYDVPVTGAGAPVDLSATAVAGWAQQDLPVYGAAVFPPSHDPGATPGAGDWPYADLTYLNSDGREVNDASYGAGGWQIDTTEHDLKGNTIRELSAGNRAQAITPTQDTDPTAAALTDSAARSQLLDSRTVYAADGVAVVDAYGPTHPVALNDGSTTSARSHTHTDYDQGAPSSPDPYRLPTTVTTSARVGGIDGGTDVDSRVTTNGYTAKTGADPGTAGWVLRKPTVVTTNMGGSNPSIVRTTYYNTSGQTVEARMPKANAAGTDAFTTLTSYYTATGSGGCVNANWTGLVCTIAPAAQPTSGNNLPTTKMTYNDLNEPITQVETVGTTTRTTTTTYDSAGRKATEATSASPAGSAGTTLPTVTYGYDPNTGRMTTISSSVGTLTTGYDNNGQVNSQTDVDGNTATTTYNVDGQVATHYDGKGTVTYTYDTATEHRGLVTSMDVGAGTAPSTFSAIYDPNGAIAAQTYPNGLVATNSYDNTGDATGLTYTKSGAIWGAFTQLSSAFGQVRQSGTPGGNAAYVYDQAGRLAQTNDIRITNNTAACTVRQYSFDLDSNRTQLTSTPDAGTDTTNGSCSTSTTPTTATHTYDQADRQTDSGYTYDLFGRTTAVPAVDATGNPMTVGYYTDDKVATQTWNGETRTYNLDPMQRIRNIAESGNILTNHYDDLTDNPAWSIEPFGGWSRNITGIDGNLAAVQYDTGYVAIQLPNMHGDITATAPDDTAATGIDSYSDINEFGVPYTTSGAYARYGYLGAKQRSAETLSGLILMGARLYNPATGRFLQVDPVAGGSANDYDYAGQDPIDGTDLEGSICLSWSCIKSDAKSVKKSATKAFNTVRDLPRNAYRQGIRLVAVLPYAEYYGGYRMNKWAASRWYAAPLRPIGWAMQARGIAGDIGLDGLKGVSGFKESIYDEHKRGNINPFHKGNGGGTFLPGLYKNRNNQPRLDWAW